MGFTRLETPDPYAKPEPILIPVGTHTLWHRGRLLWFRRELEAENGSRGDKERERLEICILGTSRKPLMQILVEARELFLRTEHAKTSIFTNDQVSG